MKKPILIFAFIALAVVAIAIFFAVRFFGPKTEVVGITNPNPSNQQVPPHVDGVQVPNGWHSHETRGMEGITTVLTRSEDASISPNDEQISISSIETSLTPEDFVPRQGVLGGSIGAPGTQSGWGIYQGHKTFSITFSSEGVQKWAVYVFGGDKVYSFILSPNGDTNPNLNKDREDFWKVITYYAQLPSFEKLSRVETQENCKNVILPADQENDVQAEPENGYVVVNFMQESKNTYAFFNYNDDLSVCTESVRKVLLNTKTHMNGMQHSSE